MGLDTVEIVIGFEEAFGIEIPDAVAETMETPRDVIDYVESNQGNGSTAACLQMRSFHRLRRALAQEGWVKRRELKLDTNLKQLLRDGSPRIVWRQLRKNHALRMPSLQFPKCLVWCGISAMIGISAFTACTVSDDIGTILPFTAILSFFLIATSYELSKPFAWIWPGGAETPRQLVQHFTMNHPNDLIGIGEVLDRNQIAETVKSITCEYCNPEHYQEDAHFLRDLGLD